MSSSGQFLIRNICSILTPIFKKLLILSELYVCHTRIAQRVNTGDMFAIAVDFT